MKPNDVTVTFEETGQAPDSWPIGTRAYEATVGYTASGHTVTRTFPYYTGPAITRRPKKRELLACLALDAQMGDQTFEDFAADFGYDTDSRKAYATWEACRTLLEDLRAVFGTHLEEFMSTEWDR